MGNSSQPMVPETSQHAPTKKENEQETKTENDPRTRLDLARPLGEYIGPISETNWPRDERVGEKRMFFLRVGWSSRVERVLDG
jgi:hypothetical protein